MNKVKKNARTNQLVNVSKTPRWQKYVFFFLILMVLLARMLVAKANMIREK